MTTPIRQRLLDSRLEYLEAVRADPANAASLDEVDGARIVGSGGLDPVSVRWRLAHHTARRVAEHASDHSRVPDSVCRAMATALIAEFDTAGYLAPLAGRSEQLARYLGDLCLVAEDPELLDIAFRQALDEIGPERRARLRRLLGGDQEATDV